MKKENKPIKSAFDDCIMDEGKTFQQSVIYHGRGFSHNQKDQVKCPICKKEWWDKKIKALRPGKYQSGLGTYGDKINEIIDWIEEHEKKHENEKRNDCSKKEKR